MLSVTVCWVLTVYWVVQDSEEMLQMRDLMANTDPLLLIVTMITSFLHMIFEYLAFKADVNFWKQTDGDVIHKFISIKSIGECRGSQPVGQI